jgi:hypothetical protein
MHFKKLITFFVLTISIFNTTYSMELTNLTLSHKVITSATLLGIGAAGGAAQAMIFNQINKKSDIDHRCNISRSAAIGLVSMLPIVLVNQFWDGNKNIIPLLTLCSTCGELFKNIALPAAYYLFSVKPELAEKNRSIHYSQGSTAAITLLKKLQTEASATDFNKNTHEGSEAIRMIGNVVIGEFYCTLPVAFVACKVLDAFDKK